MNAAIDRLLRQRTGRITRRRGGAITVMANWRHRVYLFAEDFGALAPARRAVVVSVSDRLSQAKTTAWSVT